MLPKEVFKLGDYGRVNFKGGEFDKQGKTICIIHNRALHRPGPGHKPGLKALPGPGMNPLAKPGPGLKFFVHPKPSQCVEVSHVLSCIDAQFS